VGGDCHVAARVEKVSAKVGTDLWVKKIWSRQDFGLDGKNMRYFPPQKSPIQMTIPIHGRDGE
jgi:hypothetical protein